MYDMLDDQSECLNWITNQDAKVKPGYICCYKDAIWANYSPCYHITVLTSHPNRRPRRHDQAAFDR